MEEKFNPLYLEIVFRHAFVFGHLYLYLYLDIEGKFFPLYLNKYTKRVKNSDALIDKVKAHFFIMKKSQMLSPSGNILCKI